MDIIDQLESNVKSYCLQFPAVFDKAKESLMYDEDGKEYVDFFCGAGALNYGHNNPFIKEKIVQYLNEDRITHSLDFKTTAKVNFMEKFNSVILKKRGMDYKMQFTGPTGANAVEAALKLARILKRRSNVIAFTNSFHGVSLGALSVSGNSYYRKVSGVPLQNVTFMPFDGYFGQAINTLDYFRKLLMDSSSGIDLPAAVILETIQAEGGVNVASPEWLMGLKKICNEFDILLIVDDIQVGCGRTSAFFSFENLGLDPDIILLSKSLSAYGLPFSIILIKPMLDQWLPGEHSGTFRGNNLAFVAGAEAINYFWSDDRFSKKILEKGDIVYDFLNNLQREFPSAGISFRGKGLIYGLENDTPGLSKKIRESAFRRGLIIETCGPDSRTLKILPALTIERPLLEKGLSILAASFKEEISKI